MPALIPRKDSSRGTEDRGTEGAAEIEPRDLQSYLKIISRARVGYEMVDTESAIIISYPANKR